MGRRMETNVDGGRFDAELARARELHRAGLIAEAEAAYATLAVTNPDYPELLFLQGIVAHQKGDHGEAARRIERAIAGDRTQAKFWRNLAVVRSAAGDKPGALDAVRNAATLDEKDAETWSLLGAFLVHAETHPDEAENALERALALAPNYVEARSNRALIWARTGRRDAAERELRALIAEQPEFSAARMNLSFLMWQDGRAQEGLAALGDSMTKDARLLRAALLESSGRVDEAIAAYRAMIAASADHAEAHWGLSRALLLTGQFAEGWREYEWRWRRGEMAAYRRNWDMEQWDGSPLGGRTILLHAEQGQGDAIQFVRYVPMVRAAGAGRIILECARNLQALFASIEGADTLIETGSPPPPFDCHCPLLSLPLVFGTTLDTIPAPARYLAAGPDRIANWGARLEAIPRPRVGLCWQGNPNFKADGRRSPPLAILADFVRQTPASFVSVHKGLGESQIGPAGLTDKLVVLGGIEDFADTAAIMDHLDLVVTSDTSVAHLAGALGRPTWLMTAFAPDWRWLMTRTDSPWYPSMRLFRQTAPGDWAGIARRLTDAFAKTFGP